MMHLTETSREALRIVYTNRLLEALKEADVVDKAGNVLISKDLKVIHKDSGYEYTVVDVLQSDKGLQIVLRNPDEPRFVPPPSTDILDENDESLEYNDEYEVVGDINDDSDVFVVDEKEFEKEYIVK